MIVSLRYWILAGTALAVAGLPDAPCLAQASAAAQTSTGSNATAGSASRGLEEIVVTARRREEKLQTVPIAITALTAEQIKEHNVTSVEGLQYFVPSLIVGSNNTRDSIGISIRGVGPGAGSDPGVVTYFNDVPLAQPQNSTASGSGGAQPGLFFDLENVQILKGPQGTLFGKNTIGGALLLAPHQPTNNFEGYAQVTLGDYSRRDFEGVINVPIVKDKVLLRVGGVFAKSSGFTKDITQKSDLDNVSYGTWRASLTLRPTDDIENDTVYYGLYSHNNGTGVQPVDLNPLSVLATVPGFGPVTTGPLPGAVRFASSGAGNPFFEFNAAGKIIGLAYYPTLPQIFARIQSEGPRVVENGPQNPISLYRTWAIINKTKWDINDDLSLRNTLSYLSTAETLSGNYAGLPLPYFDLGQANTAGYSQYTEELQLSGKALGDKLDWFFGGFLSYEHPVGPQFGSDCVFCAESTPLADYTGSVYLDSSRSQAVYGQFDYDLSGIWDGFDGLKFTGGYRYTWDYRSDYALRTTTNNSGQTTSLTNAASGTFQSPSWLMSANYQVDPNTLVYLSWRRGYKSGGFNTTSANPNFFFFKPEVVKTVELGIKSDWDIGGIKIRTDAAAYHNDYTRMQIAFADPTNANASLVVNGGKSQEDGFELEGKIIPISSLEISGAWNWEHAKYLQLIGPAGQNLSGTTFADVPSNKTNLNIRYFLPVDASWGSLSVAGNWAWQSHMLFDGNGGYDPLANIGSHSQFDLRLDWNEIFGEPVDASLFVTNLTDTVFRVGGLPVYPTALAYDGAYYNPPRMLGFSVKYRFGGPREESPEPAAYTPPPAVAPAPAAASRSYLVFFDFNKSDLTPQAQTIVDQAAHNAASAKVTQLTVTGHTDTVGSDAYNMRLSRRRAESVAAQLEKDGIPSSEIELVAKGKHDLLVPTGDGVREPQNRRVQIVYRDGMTSS